MSDIDQIITYRSEEHPNLLWLEVKTKDGVTGLGETFFAAEALEAYIHFNLAPIVFLSSLRGHWNGTPKIQTLCWFCWSRFGT